MSNLSDKPWLVPGHMYQYDIGWLVQKILSFETELNTAIDLKTIHYADPIQWNITTQYAPNTVVIDPKTGTAYMSKVPVPSGVLLTNTDYWVAIFNYQRIYDKIMSGVAFNDKDNLNATKDLLVNDLVWYGGDLYRATRAIPQGTTYIPGTNLAPTTIADCLATYYGRDRVAQVLNDTVNVSGDYSLHAGDIAETASHVTIHSTQDMLLDADGSLTEQVTEGKTTEVGGNLTERVTGSRELDVDGDDSIHVDGVTSINRGGALTEVYGSSVDKSVTGAFTESFEDTATSTYSGKRIVKSKDIDVTADSYLVHFPDKTVDLSNIITSIPSVTSFGAVGNGVHDDTDAIKLALNTSKALYFPAGTYLISETLSIYEPHFYGAGSRTTTIKMAEGVSAPILRIGGVATLDGLGFSFADSVSDCGAHKYVAIVLNNTYAVQRTKLSCLYFNNVGTAFENDMESTEVDFSVHYDTIEIMNFGYAGFYQFARGSSGNHYENIYIAKPLTDGIGMWFESWCNNHVFTNVNIEAGTYNKAFRIECASNVVINSITFEQCVIPPNMGLMQLGCAAIINNASFISNQCSPANTNSLIQLLEAHQFGTRKGLQGTFNDQSNLILINSLNIAGYNDKNGGFTNNDIYIFARYSGTDSFTVEVDNFVVLTYNNDWDSYFTRYAYLNSPYNIVFTRKGNNGGIVSKLPNANRGGQCEGVFNKTDGNYWVYLGDAWKHIDYKAT